MYDGDHLVLDDDQHDDDNTVTPYTESLDGLATVSVRALLGPLSGFSRDLLFDLLKTSHHMTTTAQR